MLYSLLHTVKKYTICKEGVFANANRIQIIGVTKAGFRTT